MKERQRDTSSKIFVKVVLFQNYYDLPSFSVFLPSFLMLNYLCSYKTVVAVNFVLLMVSLIQRINVAHPMLVTPYLYAPLYISVCVCSNSIVCEAQIISKPWCTCFHHVSKDGVLDWQTTWYNEKHRRFWSLTDRVCAWN